MNMNNRALGVFIPGQAVPNLTLNTPWSGMSGLGDLRDFVPALFPIPQNPISAAGGGMGQFMPACFPVPQNPIADAANIIPASAAHGVGMGSLGCGAACGGTCGRQMNIGPPGSSGMGDVSSFMASLTSGDWTGAAMNSDFITGIPNVVVILGTVWIVGSLIGDTKRVAGRVRQAPQTAKRKASAAYRAALAA